MKIGIANDHRGVKLKTKIIKYLIKKGYEVYNYGSDENESVDYPVYGFKLGEKIRDNEIDLGIIICGSGIGISIACNKVDKVRCAKVNNKEEAYYTKRDNNANVIAISGNIFTYKALDIIDQFLNTKYNGEEKYQRRIDQITEYEESNKKRKKEKEIINE